MKTQFKFKTYETKKEVIANNATGLYLLESEGELPRAVIKYNVSEYQTLKDFDICEISRDGKLFFIGRIRSVSTCGSDMEIELATYSAIDDEPPKEKSPSEDILKKFRSENPDLFTPISREEFTRVGDRKAADITKPPPDSEILNIENKIIDGTLKIEKSRESSIGEVNLKVKGSWISKRIGDIALSTRIANRFRLGKINTLTPQKLIDSWPSFGDRLSRNAKSTKYFVGMSRLVESEALPMPPITIAPDIPKITFKRQTFDNKFEVAWEYDQFMTETFSMKIINKSALQTNKKNIKINLKNVQEYLDDNETTSFFGSKNGKLILNEIHRAIWNYISISMRNITVSFEVQYNEDLTNLDCSKWITIRGNKYKITSIERNITSLEKSIKIKARGFEIPPPLASSLSPIEIQDSVTRPLRPEDVIQDIAIQNEGDVQYEKLLDYISGKKRSDQITKDNYRKLITNFLNDNQTKIQIILKPLKTQHCEERVINYTHSQLSGG
jgi:hypothetical protein